MHAPRHRFALLVSLTCAAAGCGSGSSGGGPPVAVCVAVQSRSLAWSEQSPLGFSADQLLRALGSERESRLTRADGTSTGLDLGLARVGAGAVSVQTRERESTGAGQPDAGQPCSDVLSIPVTLSFTTNDAAFDELWTLELIAEGMTSATGRAELDLQSLAGDYRVTEVDPESFDEVIGILELDLTSSAWTGALSGRALETGSGAPRAEDFVIGTFR